MPPRKAALAGVTGADVQALLAQLEKVKDDAHRFRVYEDDPVGFANDILGLPVFEEAGYGLWAKQREILEAVRDHRLVTVRSGHGTGKAVEVNTLVPTPTGMRRAGELRVGDVVFGGQGQPVPILAVHPQGTVPLYRVTCHDGASVRVCGAHLWGVTGRRPRGTRGGTGYQVCTTEELLARGLTRKNGTAVTRQWALPPSPVLQGTDVAPLPVDPYVLGAWLGDGCRGTGALTTGADDVAHFRAQGFYGVVDHCLRGPGLFAYLRTSGLLTQYSHERGVPAAYLWGSPATRLAVLSGLLDTDGTVDGRNAIAFTSTSPQLIADVQWLVRSLGGIAYAPRAKHPTYWHQGEQRQGRPAYTVSLRLPAEPVPGQPVFRLARKQCRLRPAQARYHRQWLDAIVPDGEGDAVCFTVGDPDGLFCLEQGIVTHNTHSLAILTLWWLYGTGGTVVTTASGWEQVRTVLWRQIHLLLANAKVHLPRLPEHPLQTELAITETWKAFGRSVDNPTSFQGIHDPRLMVIADEAPGIKAEVHRALRSLVTGRDNRLVMIGNPVEYGGPFWESHQPGSRFHQIHVDCYDHPNVVQAKELIRGAVTVDWIAEQREEHGEGSPEYLARVRGEFPTEGSSAVFSQKVVDRAMEEDAYALAKEHVLKQNVPVVFALDVARFGTNKTVLVERRDGVVVTMDAWQGHDATVTQDRVTALVTSVRDSGAAIGALVVDATGLGGPVADNLRRAMPWLTIVDFNGGRAARDGIYSNRRSEAYLRVKRQWFDRDRIRLPYHKQLRADLLAPTYGFNASSKLQVERKEQLERRGIESPDYGDAVLMAFVADWEVEELAVDRDPPPNQDPRSMEELLALPPEDQPYEAMPGWA